MSKFKLVSPYSPAGDQPQAIEKLVEGVEKGFSKQTLLGVTGSGKTFTIANVIEQTQLPTLVIAHNKTLAAQLCNEFREFFPNNAVEYFVSYYDYYQPEAYMPHTDTYIEKEAQINEEIDRLRHACTQALLTRKDVIIVGSVSAIYGLGSPSEYEKIVLHLKQGQNLDRRGMMEQLIEMQFERTNSDLKRGSFRMHGQVFEIMPVNEAMIYRLEISEKIDRIDQVDPVSRKVKREQEDVWFFPAKHYVTSQESRERAFASIKQELEEQLNFFDKKKKLLEYERLKRRVSYDLEMIKNIGYCNGIENYSWHFDGREVDEPPYTLLDYFSNSVGKNPKSKIQNPNKPQNSNSKFQIQDSKFLTVIDESHVTVPQIGGMYFGDRSRKDTLIEHGFRLPSARDNRPLKYAEFEARTKQVIYVSATPAEFELKASDQIVEQIVRPTGLIDPKITICPIIGQKSKIQNPKSKTNPNSKFQIQQLSQVEDLIIRIDERIKQNERVLVTTLTKKMAEDLAEYLEKKKIKVKYLHSDILTMERIEIITALRKGEIDVIVGVNLLREGLDMPEVSLVAILDADKEGFLRNDTSLIQTIGRAARNVNGEVILYADRITDSIKRAISETDRRRKIQLEYNEKHGITPKTIEKNIKNILEEFGITTTQKQNNRTTHHAKKADSITKLDLMGDDRPIEEIIKDKENKMREAAKELQFELAAILRDEVRELRKRQK
jgi:excinuclease ABC subunit B